MIPQRVAGSKTMAMADKVREMQAQGLDVISFVTGESDFDTPREIIDEAYKQMLEGNTRYVSAQGLMELRKELAADYKSRLNVPWIRPENFLATVGAKQGIHLVLSAICNPADEVLIPAPYWVSYPAIVEALQGHPKIIQTRAEEKYFPTVEALEKSWTPKTKALLLASPNNPTGLMIEEAQLKKIIEWCRVRKVILIFDELYERLVFGNTQHVSALSQVNEEESEWVICVNAFSKTFGMTGWRLGWVASHPTNIERLTQLQSQVLSCVAGFAQIAAARSMKNMDALLSPVLSSFKKRKQIVLEGLGGLQDIKLIEPEGAFYVLVDLRQFILKNNFTSCADVVQKLLEQEHVVTVAGAAFGAPNHLRISFATNEVNVIKGIQKMRQFFTRVHE